MGRDKREKDENGSDRDGASLSDETHSRSGAPTDEAHRKAGDGALTGSTPAGLTPEELRKAAEEDENVEPGTG